ncbi:unnamed protein product [Linum trigynum]|uniref:Pectinesterase inhibitor domain-containing protein n=1 Tax=Linum trigynum TaxID=586398 RepID=A0AAV2FGS7_9ROSI
MAQKPILATFNAFLLFSSTAAASIPTNLIKQTCNQTPDYNLCASTLTDDPRGPNAGDVPTHALIMIDSVKAKATSTLEEIKRLMKQTAPSLNRSMKKRRSSITKPNMRKGLG